MGLTGCGFSCLNNSGCLGLSGLNLTEGGGGGGGLLGLGGLVHGGRLGVGIGLGGVIGRGSGSLTLCSRRAAINSAFLNRE